MKFHREGLTYSCSTSPEEEPMIVETRGDMGLAYIVKVEPAFEPPGPPKEYFAGVMLVHGVVGIVPGIKKAEESIEFVVASKVNKALTDAENAKILEQVIVGMMAVINAFDDPESARPYLFPEY